MVMKPQFLKPEIEKPEIQLRSLVRPEIVKPAIVVPVFVKPILERPEYDNRCEQYIATSLLKGGLNLNYADSGGAKLDVRSAQSVALAQQMIGKADIAKASAGFTMTQREISKMTSEECSCGNGVNTANTPVVVRR